MSYQVVIKRTAEKELDTFPVNIQERIISRLLILEVNPRPPGVKKLQGENAYRLRIGSYRILYTIDDPGKLVTVYAVGHRREVYR